MSPRLVNRGLDVLTWLVLFLMLSPILWLLVSSLQTDGQLSTGAYNLLHPTLVAFKQMWSTVDFESYLINSLIICTVAAVAATGFASFAGYALARFKFRGSTSLSLGVVGTNLQRLQTDDAPRTIGYGIALSPVPELSLVADGRTLLDDSLRTGKKGTSVMGGAEFFWARRVALRVGGGYDAVNQHGYLSGGLAAISEVGAVDIGFRRDLFGVNGGDAVSVFAAGLRLFVPQP